MPFSWKIEPGMPEQLFMSKSSEIWVPEANKDMFPKGFRVNVLLEDDSDETRGEVVQWRFKVKSAVSVGLTTQRHFAPGYKLQGLGYNSQGALHDGPRILVPEFGSKWPEATEIIFITWKTAVGIKIYIVNDHSPLGLAFDITTAINERLYAYVTFSRPGKAYILKSSLEKVPVEYLSPSKQVFDGLEGYWQLTEYDGKKPERRYTATISKSAEHSFNLDIAVMNKLTCRLVQTGQSFRVHSISRTIMGVPSELRDEERKIFSLFEGTVTIKISNHDTMAIGTSKRNLQFKRFDKLQPQPSFHNPFN